MSVILFACTTTWLRMPLHGDGLVLFEPGQKASRWHGLMMMMTMLIFEMMIMMIILYGYHATLFSGGHFKGPRVSVL